MQTTCRELWTLEWQGVSESFLSYHFATKHLKSEVRKQRMPVTATHEKNCSILPLLVFLMFKIMVTETVGGYEKLFKGTWFVPGKVTQNGDYP